MFNWSWSCVGVTKSLLGGVDLVWVLSRNRGPMPVGKGEISVGARKKEGKWLQSRGKGSR